MEKPAIEGGKPICEELIPFGKPFISEEEISEVENTLKQGWLAAGPKTELFEKKLKQYLNCKHMIALDSCSSAMELALRVLGIGIGDEVITTPMSYVATPNAIVHTAAIPIFVDIEKEFGNIDPSKIENAITKKTKAILPVHYAGLPCKMDELLEIAEKNDLKVIEDAAHALEAEYNGKKIGTISDFTAFSFYANKNLTTGEGGALATENDKYAEKARILSDRGLNISTWKRISEKKVSIYDLVAAGYNSRMNDINASIGIHQIEKVEENLKKREKIFKFYNKSFADFDELILPKEMKNTKHAYHLYSTLINTDLLKIDRNKFAEALKAENIGFGIHFPSLHLTDYYSKSFGYKKGDFPNAEFFSERTISLPLYPQLSNQNTNHVVNAVEKLLKFYKR